MGFIDGYDFDDFDSAENAVQRKKDERIEEVKAMIQRLKDYESAVYEYNRLNGVLFLMDEKEISGIREAITDMLNHYIEFLQYIDGEDEATRKRQIPVWAQSILAEDEPKTITKKTSSAYKSGIDKDEVYKLYKEGKSMRKIAQQMECSPAAVKLKKKKKKRELGISD